MNDEDRERLAKIQKRAEMATDSLPGISYENIDELSHIALWDTPWLIERLEQADADYATLLEEGRRCADGLLRLSEREKALRAAAQAVLYHDERGQGIGYAEAMEALRGLLAEEG